MSRDEGRPWNRISSTVDDDDDESLPWDPLWEFVLGEDDDDIMQGRNEHAGRRCQDGGTRQGTSTDADGRQASFWGCGKDYDQREDSSQERWEWVFDSSIFNSSGGHAREEAPPPTDDDKREASSQERWEWGIDPTIFNSPDHKKRYRIVRTEMPEQKKWPSLFQPPPTDPSETNRMRRLFPSVGKSSLVKSIQKLNCASPPVYEFEETKRPKGYYKAP